MRIPLFVCMVFCAGRLMAQDSARTSATPPLSTGHPYRDPVAAAVLGTIIPGAGHIYSTEYVRGATIYLGTVGGIGSGTLVYLIDKCTFALFDTSCRPGPQWPHRTLGLIIIGAGVGIWAYSAIDAPRAARRANENHRREIQMRPLVEPRDPHRMDVGVAVSW